MKKLINWHKKIIKEVQTKANLSNYQIYWLAFFEGALIASILIWIMQ